MAKLIHTRPNFCPQLSRPFGELKILFGLICGLETT